MISCSLFGVPVLITSITPLSLQSRIESGLLIDVLRSDAGETRQSIDARASRSDRTRLSATRGVDRPLLWVAQNACEPNSEALNGTMSARLDTGGVHAAVLDALESGHAEESFTDLRIPVFVFPPLDDDVEGEVLSWIAQSTRGNENPSKALIRSFLAHSSPDVAASFETKFSHVPLRSRKVTSTLQLETAIRAAVTDRQPDAFNYDDFAVFLAQFWDALRSVRPEIAPSESSSRIKLRSASLTTSALGVGALVAVAFELFNRQADWAHAAEELLATSPLRREVPVSRSLERAQNLTGHTLPHHSLTEPIEHGELLAIQRSLIQRLMSELVDVGWSLSPNPPFDLIKGSHGLTLTSNNAAGSDLHGREVDASLHAAADLYRRYRGRMDFFDIDAPWWQVGRCVTYVKQSGKIQRRQAKSIAAKQWAGQLAVRLMD